MGILDTFKDMQKKQKEMLDTIQDNRAKKKADEDARKQAIIDGDIEPISVSVKLQPGEIALAQFTANRQAQVDRVVEHTVTKSKKKGIVSRAVVGGVLLGPLGVLGGAATAGSKGNSTTSQQQVSEMQVIDSGSIIFTNKRILFVGSEVVNLPYDKMIAVSFSSNFGGAMLNVKYEGMLKNEKYALRGDGAKEAELYYLGAKKRLSES